MDYSSFMPDGNGLSGSNVLGGVVGVLSLWHAVMPGFVDEAFSLVPHHTVFTVVPAIPVPFFWNLLTAHFFEGHLIKAAIIAPWVIALARMLERLWTPKAMAFHLVSTALMAGASVFVYELLTVYRTHSHYAFFAPVRGCVGLVVALAVGLRHAYPFEALPLVPHSWGLQCQHLPFALTAFITAVGFLFPRWLPEWPFAINALFFGWLHIRYLMWFPYAEAHGDHSPEFFFDAFFPKPIRPLASCFGAIAYRMGTSCCAGFVKLREADDTLGHAIMYDPSKAGDDETGGGLRPGSSAGAANSREYDARRAKALQLLDDNINALLAAGSRSAAAAVTAVTEAAMTAVTEAASPSKQADAGGEEGVELATMDDKDL